MGFQIRQEDSPADEEGSRRHQPLRLGEINAIGNRTDLRLEDAGPARRARAPGVLHGLRPRPVDRRSRTTSRSSRPRACRSSGAGTQPPQQCRRVLRRLAPRPGDEKAFGPNAKYFKHDVAEAKKLLAAAGFANGLELTVDRTLAATTTASTSTSRWKCARACSADIGIKFNNILIDYQTEFIPQLPRRQRPTRRHRLPLRPAGRRLATPWRLTFWYHSKAGTSFFGFDVAGKGDGSAATQGRRRPDEGLSRSSTPRSARPYRRPREVPGRQAVRDPGRRRRQHFDLAWPAVQNFSAYRGNSASHQRTQHSYWWLDQTKAPFK